MDFSKYKNSKDYGEYQSTERKGYYTEQARLEQLFYDDCAAFFGYENNPKRGQLESIAYTHGHLSGYSEVFNWLSELEELIA